MLECIREIDRSKPLVGIIENVAGFAHSSEHGEASGLETVMEKLKNINYSCDYVRLCLSSFHASQRARTIIRRLQLNCALCNLPD
eukprot:6491930-Amphidinium_carterae.2